MDKFSFFSFWKYSTLSLYWSRAILHLSMNKNPLGSLFKCSFLFPILGEFDFSGLELGPRMSKELLDYSDTGLPRGQGWTFCPVRHLLVCRLKTAASHFCDGVVGWMLLFVHIYDSFCNRQIFRNFI